MHQNTILSFSESVVLNRAFCVNIWSLSNKIKLAQKLSHKVNMRWEGQKRWLLSFSKWSKKLNGSKIKQLCFNLKLPQFWKFSSIFDERFFWWKRKMANTWNINQRKNLRHYISPKLLRIKSCGKILSIEECGVSDVRITKCCIILKESEILRICWYVRFCQMARSDLILTWSLKTLLIGLRQLKINAIVLVQTTA